MAESESSGETLETREDVASILPFLPLVLQSSSLSWPFQALEALKSMARGPDHSRVDSGEVLFLAIVDIRNSLSLSSQRLAASAADGYALFFDDLMRRDAAKKCFEEVIPAMANLLLRLPSLLEAHYQKADTLLSGEAGGAKSGLRLLDSQQAGIVFLSQELIGALLACSFFCLFPTMNRDAKHLPAINFDKLFASLYDSYEEKQENKIMCIMHYFERICSSIPVGFVSFERKVLHLEDTSLGVSYPQADFWSESVMPLCRFKVCRSGLLEDHVTEALEVDFANKYIGGGALNKGCVQEEIRFMINPELILCMLFLPSMADNEAIEIVGVERFANYTGYASSFRFAGNHVDNRDTDSLGRRKTRIIAIDALCSPRMRQYRHECLLREINKAFCGFSDQCKYHIYQKLFEKSKSCSIQADQDAKGPDCMTMLSWEPSSVSAEMKDGIWEDQMTSTSVMDRQHLVYQDGIGIVTGNWGCGAFGGDPELKTVIQWIAASQALRPFVSYFTFGIDALQSLDQVSQWILSHEWTVGELWNMLIEYSSQRLNGETDLGFFEWLLPTFSTSDAQMQDISHTP